MTATVSNKERQILLALHRVGDSSPPALSRRAATTCTVVTAWNHGSQFLQSTMQEVFNASLCACIIHSVPSRVVPCCGTLAPSVDASSNASVRYAMAITERGRRGSPSSSQVP